MRQRRRLRRRVRRSPWVQLQLARWLVACNTTPCSQGILAPALTRHFRFLLRSSTNGTRAVRRYFPLFSFSISIFYSSVILPLVSIPALVTNFFELKLTTKSFPAVGSNCQSLWLGYAYCVRGPAASSSITPTSSAAPTQSGIVSNCNKFYTVQSGDSCAGIESQFSITFAQLYQWNPSIGSNCQSLYVGYAVCVGVQ